MFQRTVTSDDLARLKREREAADRLYNDALTILDAAIQRLPDLRQRPLPGDQSLLPLLRELQTLELAERSGDERGWRAWLRALVVRIVRPALDRQASFNSALIDHLNRQADAQRETREAVGAMLVLLHDQLAALVSFQSRLIQYAQQITPYVDTKDREVSGLMRRIQEDNSEAIARLTQRLEPRLDELAQRVTAVTGGLEAVAGSQRVLREVTAVVQGTTTAIRRQIERMTSAAPAVGPSVSRPAGEESGDVEAVTYVGFEDAFRGTRAEIKSRQQAYVKVFEGATDVVDLGCGRGEFLELLQEAGIQARGLDANPEMVSQCRARNLAVDESDALAFLDTRADESLGGLFAAQVVEHLPAAYLMRLVRAAHRTLRPGAPIVLETINPACWAAFFSAYIRDFTHRHPIHPETLRFLLHANGFSHVELVYSTPHPEAARLLPVPPDRFRTGSPCDEAIMSLAGTLNENVARLNALLFTHHDYAAIGYRR